MKQLGLILFFFSSLGLYSFAQDLGIAGSNTSSYKKVLVLKAEERYDKAREVLDGLIASSPKKKEYYLDRASCHEQLGDWDWAVRDYNAVLRFEPTYYEALFSRAQAYFQNGDHAMAIRDLEKLLEAPRSETKMVYFKMSENGLGESYTSGVGTLSDSHAEILNFMGKVRLDINDYDGAKDAFNKAIALQSKADYYVSRGLLFERMEMEKEAKVDYRKALILQPNNKEALYNLATLAEYEGNTLDAIKMYDKIIENEYGFSEAYFNRGYSYFEAGLYKKALTDFDSALALGYNDVDVYLNRGLTYQKLKNYEQALVDYGLAIEKSPKSEKAYAKRAGLYFAMKKYQKAAEDYTTAIAYKPSEAKYFYNRGISYYNERDYDNACADLQWAISLGFEQAKAVHTKICQSD
ncbi:tetratricopeptide repeat protein [Flammeovirgaceae bacterium SG7u.111]|nr:tetratricopeptide repeat protein [Flammeovirgaceae bacterium SG7u.132]WPO33074.1 tetratricopeptide repeat protein [Flammeovirgaceae bacterium SG7u.111]